MCRHSLDAPSTRRCARWTATAAGAGGGASCCCSASPPPRSGRPAHNEAPAGRRGGAETHGSLRPAACGAGRRDRAARLPADAGPVLPAPLTGGRSGAPPLLRPAVGPRPDDPRRDLCSQVVTAKFAELGRRSAWPEAGNVARPRIVRTNAGSINMTCCARSSRRSRRSWTAGCWRRSPRHAGQPSAGRDRPGRAGHGARPGRADRRSGCARYLAALRRRRTRPPPPTTRWTHQRPAGRDGAAPHGGADGGQRGDPALRLHRVARPAGAAGQHHGLHQRAGAGRRRAVPPRLASDAAGRRCGRRRRRTSRRRCASSGPPPARWTG